MGVELLPDLDNRRFRGIENYDDGDLNAETRFQYFQRGRAVWGVMSGGGIAHGGLVARLNDDSTLTMRWHYVTPTGKVVSGDCVSQIEILPDNRIRLHERWKIDGPEGEQGRSIIEEIRLDPE